MATAVSMAEVRKTIATSLGAALGFVIALLWGNVVFSGVATAGINLNPSGTSAGNWGAWGMYVVTAVVLTIVMIVLIMLVGRWGGKAK